MRNEGIAHKSVLDCTDDQAPLLASGRDVGAYGGEGLGTAAGTEGTGDLLFHLNHADVSFCQVVVEGHTKIIHERKHLGFVLPQAVEQVLGWCLLLTPAFPGRRVSRRRIGDQALLDQFIVTLFIIRAQRRRQASVLGRGGPDFSLDFQQQQRHFLRSGLLILLDDELQFTQMVRITEGVFITMQSARDCALIEGQIGLPVVMHSPTVEFRQDADGPHAFLATFGMYAVVGEMRGAGHMQPVHLTGSV